MADQSQMEQARQFALSLSAFAAVAAKMAQTDDAEAHLDVVKKRLDNKAKELAEAIAAVEQAKEKAASIVEDGRRVAESHIDTAKVQASKVIEDAQHAARQLIVNATGDAEAQNAMLSRTVAEQEMTRERLAGEIKQLVSNKDQARADAEDAALALKALKAEIAALKSRF